MENTVLTAGIACILAAIVGGGLKAFSLEIPLLKTWSRQAVLGTFGIILLIIAVQMKTKPEPKTPPSTPPQLQAVVQYAQRGGPFAMLGEKGLASQTGYSWNQMEISFENDCAERIFVQPDDFRLFVSSKVTIEGAQNFYPVVTEPYPGRLSPTWVEPGAKLQGRLVFEVPDRLADGHESNGSYHIIRRYSQDSCRLVYKPY